MVGNISSIASYNIPTSANSPNGVSSVVSSENTNDKSLFLTQKYNEVKDKQGCLGKSWDNIKDVLGVGFSSQDCENVIAKYEKGEVSFDEAMEAINKFERKQNNGSELLANIGTGIASIAVATAVVTGPIGWIPALLIGAPVGLLSKVGIKMADRATNNVDNDVLNGKDIAKDAISGAVTGMTSAVSSGVAAGVKSGKFWLSVKNGAISGLECGAVSGATTYATDIALNKDKKFKTSDFLETTIVSSLVSGSVGGIVGGGIYGKAASTGAIGAAASSSTLTGTIIKDSTSSSARKLFNRAERDVVGIA